MESRSFSGHSGLSCLIRPHREDVARRIAEMETATAGEAEDFLNDIAACRNDGVVGGFQLRAVNYRQRRRDGLVDAKTTADAAVAGIEVVVAPALVLPTEDGAVELLRGVQLFAVSGGEFEIGDGVVVHVTVPCV